MAILQSRPFADHNALGKHGSTSDMRAFQGRKVMRVSCQQNFVSSGSEQRVGNAKNNQSQDQAAADMLQNTRSPLFNLPPQEWPTTLGEKENVKDPHHVIVPAALKQRDSVSVTEGNALHQVAPTPPVRKQVKFTAEKARQLRKELRATETFHDKWYHSAIASRLARPEQ